MGHRNHQENRNQQLQLWNWSSGQKQADAVADIPKDLVLAIAFNPNDLLTTEFAITTKQTVLFGSWCDRKSPALITFTPPLQTTNLDFVMTTYCERSRCPITISQHGTCTLWSRSFGDGQYAALKTVCIGRTPLKWSGYVDEMLVVLDVHGRMRFFDENMHIIYVGEEGNCMQLQHVCFDLMGRQHGMVDPQLQFDSSNRVRKRNRPTTNLAAVPFVVRNCVALDGQGHLMRCDLVQQTTDQLPCVESAAAHITAFDVHQQRNLLCAGCSDGQLFTYDYAQRERVAARHFPAMDGGASRAITFLMFAKSGTQLIVFMESGQVYIVDVIMLQPVGRPIRPTDAPVRLACISKPGHLFAYCDARHTAVLVGVEVTPDSTNLLLIGKNRAHSEAITVIEFVGPEDERLITFGADRHVTVYNVRQSIGARTLVVVKRKRCEQSAQVIGATLLNSDGLSPVLMTCDNESKIKTWHLDTLSVNRTTVGPLLDEHPVQRLCRVPSLSVDDVMLFMAFSTAGKTMGLQLMPFDGNAYRHVGMIAHPNSIRQMYALGDGRTLITLGETEHTIFVWSIQRSIVIETFQRVGDDLSPFVMALPGGRNGWLFREMLDFFYYMQFLSKNPDFPLEQMTSDTDSIRLTDVPDWMRGLGVFLGEWEETNLLNELSGNRPQLACNIPVRFGELLKAYVNHRPARGYQIAKVRQAMEYFCEPDHHDEGRHASVVRGKREYIDRDHLVHVCCSMGEKMGRAQASRYLIGLLVNHEDDDQSVEEILDENEASGGEVLTAERMLENAPELFNMRDFLVEILGLESSNDENLIKNRDCDANHK